MTGRQLFALAALVSSAFAAPQNPAEMVKDKYIVRLKDTLSTNEIQAHKNEVNGIMASRFTTSGARFNGITNNYNTVLKGYAGHFDAATVAEIKKNKDVLYVEKDQIATVIGEEVQEGAEWGLSRVSHRDVADVAKKQYKYDSQAGEGVRVYVVDTGIRVTHNEFKNADGTSRAVWGASFTGEAGENDGNGHGTHCAGTVAGKTYGVAKKATVVAVRVLNAGGSGSYSGVISGMEWAAKDAVSKGAKAVVSMSLGGPASQAVDDAVAKLVKDGVTTVVAAGNSRNNASNNSPARAPDAITVGASDINDNIASFSCFGELVDIFGPGVNVKSSVNSGDDATATFSGTSMACPHVAGVSALILGGGHASNPAGVVGYIKQHSTKDVIKLTPAAETAKTTKHLVYSRAVASENPEEPPEEPENPPEEPEEPPKDECCFEWQGTCIIPIEWCQKNLH